MATQDVESGRIVNDGPAGETTPVEAAEKPKNTKWYVELPYVLNNLAFTFDRAFVIIGVIAVGATAVAYWGAYTGHYYVAVGGMVIVGLAMLAWIVATTRMLWVVAKGVVRWQASRRSNSPINESTESAPG
jgi:uncharacterized membrane protein